MLCSLIHLCETASYSERITYRRTIVQIGYPVKVREDYSVVVAGRKVRWGFKRVIPTEVGEVSVEAAYDNGNPFPFKVKDLSGGTEIALGEGCLAVGKHRISVKYDLYPRLRGDTLIINVLNGEVPVPVDYVEVVVVSEGEVHPLVRRFNITELPALGVVRISGNGPFSGDTVLNVPLRIKRPKVEWRIPTLLMVVSLLLHAASGLRRA